MSEPAKSTARRDALRYAVRKYSHFVEVQFELYRQKT